MNAPIFFGRDKSQVLYSRLDFYKTFLMDSWTFLLPTFPPNPPQRCEDVSFLCWFGVALNWGTGKTWQINFLSPFLLTEFLARRRERDRRSKGAPFLRYHNSEGGNACNAGPSTSSKSTTVFDTEIYRKIFVFRHNESSIQNLHNRSLSNTWTSFTGFHGSHRTMFVILPVWSTWPAVMSQIRTWIKNSSMPWKVLQSEWFAVWVGIKLPDLVLIFGCKLAAGNLGQWFLIRLLAGMRLLHKGNFHVVAGGWGKGSWQWSCADSRDYHPLSWLILLGVAAAVTRLCYERCPNWMHSWMVPTTNKVRGCLAEDSHIISCILLRSVSEASRDSGNTNQLKEDYLFPSFLPQKRKIIQQLPCLVGCESTGHDYADSKLLGEQGVLGPFSEVTKDEVRRHSILFDTCVCWYRLGIPKEPGNMPCQKPRWGVHCYSGPLCARKAWP